MQAANRAILCNTFNGYIKQYLMTLLIKENYKINLCAAVTCQIRLKKTEDINVALVLIPTMVYNTDGYNKI